MSPHMFTVLFIMDQLFLLAPGFLASPHFPITQHHGDHDTTFASTTSFYSSLNTQESSFVATKRKRRRFSWFSPKESDDERAQEDITGIRPWTPVVPQQQSNNELLFTSNVAVKTLKGRKRKRNANESFVASPPPQKKKNGAPLQQQEEESPTRSVTPTDPSVDLSGRWKLHITDSFKKEYDTYLRNLGQPPIVRSIAVSVISRTSEATRQEGSSLWIQSTNPRGVWERTLIADPHATTSMQTIDKETVQAQAWWEENVHISWLRGVTKYGGGSFESKRYLQDGLLCCESIFHPIDTSRPTAQVTWRFTKVD